MTTTWRVRQEGSPHSVSLPDERRVLEGLRDGEWDATDEVRGPADGEWVALADHPAFAAAAEELIEPAAEPPDESRLDMNPLIDVSLVLLIFFVLTASYTSLRRAIELPPAPPDKAAAQPVVKPRDIKDQVFKVKVTMAARGKPLIEVEGRGAVREEELEAKILDVVKTTGRKEMFADVAGDVPWGLEAKLYDAAKAAGVHQIYWPKGK